MHFVVAINAHLQNLSKSPLLEIYIMRDLMFFLYFSFFFFFGTFPDLTLVSFLGTKCHHTVSVVSKLGWLYSHLGALLHMCRKCVFSQPLTKHVWHAFSEKKRFVTLIRLLARTALGSFDPLMLSNSLWRFRGYVQFLLFPKMRGNKVEWYRKWLNICSKNWGKNPSLQIGKLILDAFEILLKQCMTSLEWQKHRWSRKMAVCLKQVRIFMGMSGKMK